MFCFKSSLIVTFEICVYLLREATEELIEKLREDEAHILWRENRPSVPDELNPLGGLCVCVKNQFAINSAALSCIFNKIVQWVIQNSWEKSSIHTH